MNFDLKSLLVLAATIYAVVETVKPLWDRAKWNKDSIASLISGLFLAIGVNVFAGLNVFDQLGIPLTENFAGAGQWVGIILTGILCSQGAGAIHSLIKLVTEARTAIPGMLALRKLDS